MYGAAGLVGVIGLFWALTGPMLAWLGWLIFLGAFGFSLWTLLVTWRIYDRSGLYAFEWLEPEVRMADRLLNVTIGFDESTNLLRQRFPWLEVSPIAIKGEGVGGGSIERARRYAPAESSAWQADIRNWPAIPACDVILFFFAAHEIRSLDKRRALFESASKVTPAGGRAVVVEHLRDRANFLAYGPGACHFLTLDEWRKTFEPHWRLAFETTFTPYLRIFYLRKGEEP